eukprot:10065630-Alexandrium_andersonii.AAC.1
MSASLVGSEMCIRDRCAAQMSLHARVGVEDRWGGSEDDAAELPGRVPICLLYTSDAADDM